MGLALLVKYQMDNLVVQALSEISGQSVEELEAKLQDQRMPDLLKDSGVDRKSFHSVMRAKINNLVKQATNSGSITPEQEKDILDKMERHVQRHELMTRLIEKGVEDGTITPEQARILLRRPF